MVDDQTTLQRARALDPATLTDIYDTYHPRIYRYVYRQVGHVEVARDLTSEVFERFLQALNQGGGPEQHLASWLYGTARNVVANHYRRQGHREPLPLHEELIDAGDAPDKIVARHIASMQVQAALKELTMDQQQVIILRFLEGLPSKEVARLLSKSVGAVKALQHRALAALQRHLEREQV
jgi:RNA polymerase sigma-70 factor (ECF subfamily)